MTEQTGRITSLNPLGFKPEIELTALAPRLNDFNSKTVYLINSMPQGTGLERVLEGIHQTITSLYPHAEIISKNRGAKYMMDDPELREEMISKGDAFIYAGNPTSSLTSEAIIFASKLEKAGLPGAVIIYDTFLNVATSTCERIGAPIRFQAVSYPTDFIPEEEMNHIVDEIGQALVTPLTEKEIRNEKFTPNRPNRAAFTGSITEIQDFFHSQGWTDGMPIVPPTEECVEAMLKGTSHAPDEMIAPAMIPEGLEVTVEQVAINGVMAGCEPEYIPVLLALIEASVIANIGAMTRSINSFSFMQVVNGPIAKELQMNSETYALGPGNRANATIGRALALFILNLGGGRVGTNIMGAQGNPSSYSFCFAENEKKSPWEPLSVENGYTNNDSVLSLFSGGWSHLGNYTGESANLIDVSKSAATLDFPNGAVLLLSPQKARILHDSGMDKSAVKDHFWKNATLTMGEFRSGSTFNGIIKSSMKQGRLWPKEYLDLPNDSVVPVYPRENINIVVVGGDMAPVTQLWKMGNPTVVSIDKWR